MGQELRKGLAGSFWLRNIACDYSPLETRMDTAEAGEAGAAGNGQSFFLPSCSGLFHVIPQELDGFGLPLSMAATDHGDC